MAEQNNSLKKALSILDCFIYYDELTIAEIVKLTGYSKTSVQRILTTLQDCSYIIRKPSGAYITGLKTFELGAKSNLNKQLATLLSGVIEELAHASGFMAHVHVLDENYQQSTVYNSLYTNVDSLSMIPNSPKNKSPNASAGGKCLVAFNRDYDVIADEIDYQKKTEYTIGNAMEFRKELSKIQKQGYSTDDEEVLYGFAGIAMPVITSPGENPICAISVTGHREILLESLEENLNLIKIAVDKAVKKCSK